MPHTKAKKDIDQSTLPEWDLSRDFYSSPNDPRIMQDLADAQTAAEAFAAKYKGKIASLSGDELAEAISEYEAFVKKAGKPGLYVSLLLSSNTQDPDAKRLNQTCSELGAKISEPLTFWSLDIAALDKAELNKKYEQSSALEHWRPWLDEALRFKEYNLSETEEKLLTRISPTSTGTWVDFYDEEKSRLTFKVKGKYLNETELEALVDDPSEDVRRAVLEARVRTFHPDSPFLRYATKLMNTLIADKAIDDEQRGFEHPMSSQNLGNNIEDSVVDTLIDSVKKNYHRTTHRYYKLKAEILGKEKFEAHNSFAPPPAFEPTTVTWEEAKQMVLESYREFSPKMAEYAQKMFDEGYIDAPLRKGKDSGAYAMPPHGGVDHPFLFMNFQGKPDNVMTLAHELGHNIHQWMAHESQGLLMQGTPLTLSETASTFGENLVFEKLLKRIKSPTERKVLLMNKIEDGLGTIETQIQIVDFEREAHEKRKHGELSTEALGAIWLKKLKERGGPNYVPMPGQENDWARIPHIFATPFYVYSYAFGESLVEAMFAAWREGKIDNFQEKYIDMLKAGGTKHHKDLLSPMELDASNPDFWEKGIKVREHYMDELELLVKQEKAALAALDGASVKSHGGHYTIEVSRSAGETPDDYKARTDDIAGKLNVALGCNADVSRGTIKIDHADGVVAEKLNAMAKQARATACG